MSEAGMKCDSICTVTNYQVGNVVCRTRPVVYHEYNGIRRDTGLSGTGNVLNRGM
jgi:hypothetical protein